MSKFTLQVNGRSHEVDVGPETPLLWVLRDNLDLVGTKFGCGIGQCAACTVHLDGTPARACLTPVSAAQCGYCQPGQLMSAAALLAQNPNPSDGDIDEAMAGNICRCATYFRIRAGIHRAAELMAAGKEARP